MIRDGRRLGVRKDSEYVNGKGLVRWQSGDCLCSRWLGGLVGGCVSMWEGGG